jgi:hypothetical protein
MGTDAEIPASIDWKLPRKKVLLMERCPNFILGTEIAGRSICLVKTITTVVRPRIAKR